MKRIFALTAALTLLCCLLSGCADDLAVNDREESLPRVTSNVTSSPDPEHARDGDSGMPLPGTGKHGDADSGSGSGGEGPGPVIGRNADGTNPRSGDGDRRQD